MLTMRLCLLSKTLKMECVDNFTLLRTIRLRKNRNLYVHQTTLPTWKINYRKGIMLIFVHERERERERERECQLEVLQTEKSQFLQRYSKMYQWIVKILYYLNRSWKIKMWIALLTNRTPKNHTKTIFASSGHLLSTCVEMRDSKKNHPNFSTFSWTIVAKKIHQSFEVFAWLIFRKWRRRCNSTFSLRHWLCGWKADWGTSMRKHLKVWK